MKKKRFEFSCLISGDQAELKNGDEGGDVRALQTFLTQMGYLGRNRLPGKMCDYTCEAIQHFQRSYGFTYLSFNDDKIRFNIKFFKNI